MNTKELIFELCCAMGVSGREEPALSVAEKFLSDYTDDIKISNGSLMAVCGNKNSDKTILLDAHIDRIGFMVTEINENGFVKASPCGGIDARTLADTLLCVQNNPDVTGVVCCMPPHLSDGKEDKAMPIDKIWVDFGLPYDEVNKLISFGDMLTFASKPANLLNGRIVAPCLDNRCGVASLVKCAELLKDNETDYKVIILLSSQEETFGTGAKTGAFTVEADESIVVDVSFASQPDVSGFYSSVELDKGPMICISSILNKEMSKSLESVANNKNIPYQLEPIAGRTGTNADHISISGKGVKTAVVSIPQRYMHTQNEVISVADVDNTAKLIAEYIKCGGAFND